MILIVSFDAPSPAGCPQTMVGWGPAHSDGVHTGSIGFWGSWLIALAIGLGLATLMTVLRERRRERGAVRS